MAKLAIKVDTRADGWTAYVHTEGWSLFWRMVKWIAIPAIAGISGVAGLHYLLR